VAKENHALKSQAGRVPHVQRRLKELDQKLEELTKRSSSPSNRPSTNIQPKVLEALKGIRETDAELADTIAAAIAQATDGVSDEFLSRERENLTSQRAQTYSDYQDGEASRLLDMYPNAKEVFSSPTWKEWKTTQSSGIQNLADSDSADDVSYAFKKYAEDMVAKYPELAKTEVTPVEAPTVNDPKAAKIEEERARKLAASVVMGTPNAAGKSALPSDPKALFEQYSKQIRKEITGG